VHHRQVLGEIHSALLALPALQLNVLACRADESQRRVAHQAKLRAVRVIPMAFGAIHSIFGRTSGSPGAGLGLPLDK